MPIPSWARALLWGREARRQAFETEAGRELVATAYYDDGLVADGDFYMLEEDVLVTAEGGEILSAPAPPELPVV